MLKHTHITERICIIKLLGPMTYKRIEKNISQNRWFYTFANQIPWNLKGDGYCVSVCIWKSDEIRFSWISKSIDLARTDK